MAGTTHGTTRSPGGRSKDERGDVRVIDGLVRSDAGEPVPGALVTLYGDLAGADTVVGRAKADEAGAFVIDLRDDRHDCDVHVGVTDGEGRVLIQPATTSLHLDGASINLDLTVPPQALPVDEPERPLLRLGPLRADALAVAEAEPELALDVARVLLGGKVSRPARDRVTRLLPDVGLRQRRAEPLCYTSVLEALDALIVRKGWPRDIALSCDAILRMDDTSFATATYNCPNFSITYDTTQVDADTSAATVFEPGSNPPVAIGSLPAGGPPTYVKRICFWLERALAAYVGAPFSMRNPAAGGRIPVVVNTSPYGSASPSGTFYLNNALNPDLLCAVAVHELFHMVQYEYGGTGTWRQSVFEGGAVFAEDTAADLMNRYLDEAGTNFNGTGVLGNTNLSLDTASYKCSLFWRYISEQQSWDQTEPFIGVETYRHVIELCSAGSYSAANVRQAIRELPWYQDFYEFGYLDPAKLDRTSSETTLGNYALACRLKDLGVSVPDRRFEFVEDEEDIFIDQVIPGAPLQTTLASVTLAGTATVSPSAVAVWSGSVNRFAHRFYEVVVDPAATNVQVSFAAGSGLTSRIFQIALIDTNGVVRDIHRTDAASYSKHISNDRDGVKLAKLVLVVTGADSTGTFSLTATSAAAAPDVMVTRWHSVSKTEYEIDSSAWAWTWVSPDIWVDNDGNGIADSVVHFNTDNALFIRLHNKGNADAAGVGVQFWYQDASPGLSHAGWLPVRNTAGVIQTLTGLTVAPGTTDAFTVDWSPSPSGTSSHFCVRALVTSPGDPNTDNKRVLSNFGNVRVAFRKPFDLDLVRRNILDRIGPITMRVVPRLTPDLRIAQRDLKRLSAMTLAPGEEVVDTIRLTHHEIEQVHEHQGHEDGAGPHAARGLRGPDPAGHYAADERTLPPGVAGRPMVTIVHEVDGVALGGVTYLVTVEQESKRHRNGAGGRDAASRSKASGRVPRSAD